MARKSLCCKFTALEFTLIVLFVLMTGITVGLLIILGLHIYSPEHLNTEDPTASVKPVDPPYLIGVGRADCTGPVADVPLMGYANPDQTAGGIHTRLFSRAFIVDDGSKRVAFVNAEIGMVSQRLRLEVLRALEVKYGTLYRQDNVILSGTHTHSGPAGYFQYTLFMITSKGYIKSSIQALVNGIVKSIDEAHNNMRPGKIFVNKGDVLDSNLNRSPHSYINNPEEERKSWFAVHPVSMNYTNHMVSSDNLGYAAYLFEQERNVGFLPGEGPFVAAFPTSNSGDVSPNTRGPHCINTGEKCDYLNSSCPIGGSKMCTAFGPGIDMFESTRIIGENIYLKAKELYSSAQQEVHGKLHTAHQWVNMTDVTVPINSTHSVKTCKPALGHGFAAGTTDGGGDLNFTQGATEGDPFWDGIRDTLLGKPSQEIQDCQNPKPILLSTGEELETNNAFTNTEVVITGLCNIYTHYITTYEEYQAKTEELPKGLEPPFFKESQLISLVPAPPADKTPFNTTFGEVLEQVNPLYKVGAVASVTFVAGNPRNSGDMRGKTFVTVEKFLTATSTWRVVHTDASWETRFHWIKGTSGQSNATVEWHIPLSAETGTYRIRHFGHSKKFSFPSPVFTPYEGISDTFRVTKTLYSF
ncbi:Neutral ceramidase [Bagarius yarrelli]|uniref:Neutral ceramidase n=1 Tax=Bagarius yarrelli TaxID=175774 RepID=A0A556TII1_BAGYA|nr:Neutral ceramidase [Bagarius yarrelli]